MEKLLIYFFFKFLSVHNETNLQQVHSLCRNMVQYPSYRNAHLLSQLLWQIEAEKGVSATKYIASLLERDHESQYALLEQK